MVANKRKGSKPESGRSAFELETSDDEEFTMPGTSDPVPDPMSGHDRDKNPPKPAKSRCHFVTIGGAGAVKNRKKGTEDKKEKEDQSSLKPEWIMICVVCVMVAVLAISVKSEIATLKQSFEFLSRELPISQRGIMDVETNNAIRELQSALNGVKETIKYLSDKADVHRHELTSEIQKMSAKLVTKEELRGKLTDFKEENIDPMSGQIGELNGQLRTARHEHALNEVKETIKYLSDKADVHRHELTSEIQKMSAKLVTKEELRGKLTDFKEENIDPMSGQIGELNGQLRTARHEHATDYKALSNKHSNMVNTMDKHKAEMDGLSSAIGSYQTNIQNKAEELKAKLKTADQVLKQFESEMSNMTQKLDIHDEDLDTAFNNLFNKKATTIVIVLMLSMNFGLVVAVYILCQGRSNRGALP